MFDIPFSNDRNPPGENPPKSGKIPEKHPFFYTFIFLFAFDLTTLHTQLTH